MQVAQALIDLCMLPSRFGPRPRSTMRLPFRQLDQAAPGDMPQRLLKLCLDLPRVQTRQSRLALPQCRALSLRDCFAGGPREAFIDANEFCHLLPDGSAHLTLPPAAVESVIALGWAERHPIHALGILQTLVMVYAPRDAAELEMVGRLIACSCRFATGPAARLAACNVA